MTAAVAALHDTDPSELGPVTERCPRSVMQVPRIRTSLGELELAAVLRDAHTHVFGEPPSADCLAVAWAQCAFEHGHGRFLDCYCIGNVTADRSWGGDYFVIVFSRDRNPYDAPKDSTATTFEMRFRAFDDAIDGARNYWETLQHHYASALLAFEGGNPAVAAMRLKAAGYFTAPLEPYQRSMVSLCDYARKHVLAQL